MMLPSRLGCPLSRKTPNMGNTGQEPVLGRDVRAHHTSKAIDTNNRPDINSRRNSTLHDHTCHASSIHICPPTPIFTFHPQNFSQTPRADMKLLLIHLSDIHFTAANDVIFDRSSAILNAVKNLDYSLDLCVVVVTGDIAYSGSDEQYIIALEFFEQLKQLLSNNLSGTDQDHAVPVNLIVVPGNHDCDFAATGPHRDVIVNSILGDSSPASDPTIVHTCTAVVLRVSRCRRTFCTTAREPALSREFVIRV